MSRSAGALEAAGGQAFLLSVVATFVFYFPALLNGSTDAGFLYGGDVLGFYWPSLIKLHSVISSHSFSGIDFSLFNGSSDLFLTPNLFNVHPLFVLYALVTGDHQTTMQNMGHLLVVVLALHSFASCYFALRLAADFFDQEFWPAAFIGIGFAFSVQMISALGEPQFVFCASTVPWATYLALRFPTQSNWRALLWAALPIVVAFVGGYIPVGVACIAMSVVLLFARIVILDRSVASLDLRLRRLCVAMMPYTLGTIVVSAYLWATFNYVGETPSGKTGSVFYAAHQLADAPQTILRALSFRYSVPGIGGEFSVRWGFIGIAIFIMFLLCQKAFESTSSRNWDWIKISAVIYFITALSTFGNFSAVSDLVYYFVPQVGRMHIYQRFLLPAHLTLCMMLAIMLASLVKARPLRVLRGAFVFFALLLFSAAFVLAKEPAFARNIGVNGYIVFELMLACLFVFFLLVSGKTFAFVAAIVLFNLPALDVMYDLSTGKNTREAQQARQGLFLDDIARANFLKYLKRFGNKAVIKYVDLTPMWSKNGTEPFPKALPHLLLNDVRLSSYHGFNFYLSPRADYMRRMPVETNVALNPDWDWVEASGADFVVAIEEDIRRGVLAPILGEKPNPADFYHLPNGVVAVSLRGNARNVESQDAFFDNGYFRVRPPPPNLGTQDLPNLALGKPSKQSTTANEGVASRAVDGNTDGDFAAGSVTHTGAEPNPWIEVDLEAVHKIESVRLWNRTDCCSYRLNDYWVFVSREPFGLHDTAEILRKKPGVWSAHGSRPNPSRKIVLPGAEGRYVRVQLSENPDNKEPLLSLAEIEVYGLEKSEQDGPAVSSGDISGPAEVTNIRFESNFSNKLRLDLHASKPVEIEYLLTLNPRFKTFVNGKLVAFVETENRAPGIRIPAGDSRIEMRYSNKPLSVFWAMYFLYGLSLFVAMFPLSWRRVTPWTAKIIRLIKA